MPEFDAARRPHCSTCGVDMWLTRIGEGPAGRRRYLFECTICGARTLVSAGQGDTTRIEDGL